MTPDQARQIDQAEFTAGCRAAREHVHVVIAQRRAVERATALRWIGQQAPGLTFNVSPPTKAKTKPAPLPRAKAVRSRGPRTAQGLTMPLREWAAHLGITLNSLHQRMHKSNSFDAAIALGGPRLTGREPGVAKNLAASSGTGGGSTTQDLSEIEISE